MIAAPVLQEVAARLAGRASTTLRSDPVAWAYELREAVALARPQAVVSHHDPALEADALLAAAGGAPGAKARADGAQSTGDAPGGGAGVHADDLLDVDLAAEGSPTAAVRLLVTTLAALLPGTPVLTSVTGPATVAATLARAGVDGDPRDLLDAAADALAPHAAACVEAGARTVVVWEAVGGAGRCPAGFGPADLAAAHRPLLRRLELLGVEPLLVCPLPVEGYRRSTAGGGVALLAPARFAGAGAAGWGAPDPLDPDLVALSDGPVPGDAALAALVPPTAREHA